MEKNADTISIQRGGKRSNNWTGGVVKLGRRIGIWFPNHVRAMPHGYVFRYLLIAEKALGRPIPRGCDVHHVNEIPSDDRSGNLVICEDTNYHRLLHRRALALREFGDPNAQKCKYCKQWGMDLRTYSRSGWHHVECHKTALRQTFKRRKEKNEALESTSGHD